MSDQEKQSHVATDPNGFMRGCRCDLTEDHDVVAFGPCQFVAGGPVAAPRIRVAELRPHGIGKTADAEATREAWKRQEDLTASFVGDRYLVHVQQSEEQLKEVLRAALKLIEENPRNEPMRTPVHRSAVERMLAEDVRSIQEVAVLLSSAEQGRLVKALFDAGWRPTIDRLVR